MKLTDVDVVVVGAGLAGLSCARHQSVPGIQWALLSGRHAAEAVIKELAEIPG